MSLGTMEQRTEGMKRQAQDLIEQAYHRGFKAGREDRQDWEKDQADRLIEKGRNEAWEAAKKLDDMEFGELKGLFDGDPLVDVIDSIFNHITASEAINKLRAYENQKKQEEDKEIHVGDVIRDDDVEAVVTWCDGKNWNGFLLKRKNEDVGEVGQVYSCMSCNDWKKTGRHFPEIAEVLKKMKEGE